MGNTLWKNWFLLVLGLWTAVLPFLGFPSSWRTVFLVLTGLAMIALSFGMAQPICTHTPPPDAPRA